MKTLLLLDTSCLCYRAYHTTGSLSFDHNPTGVAFGLLREVQFLFNTFATKKIAFAFDSRVSKRKQIYSAYKENRRSPQSNDDKSLMHAQIKQIKEDVLPSIGFNNLFEQEGYEADDIIASICNTYEGNIIVVSMDEDLFQLLSDRVSVWSSTKKKMTTLESFQKDKGIHPNKWVEIKAMAGDVSDNIKGIGGIGEKSAIAYLNKTLKGKKYEVAHNADQNLLSLNKQLMQLPLDGVNEFEIVKDNCSRQKWNDALNNLGIKQLRML